MMKPMSNWAAAKVALYIIGLEALIVLTIWQLNQIHALEAIKVAAMRLLGLSVD